MDHTIKIWLIIGAVLVVLGFTIFAIIMTVNHWDFSRLSTVKYVTNTHSFSEAVTDISIKTATADILFALSEDDSCKVVCHEQENLLHTVALQDGTLTIRQTDERKWYDYVGISFGSTKITLYLPQSIYGMLTVGASTGNVTLPKEFGFESMEISITTGDIRTSASVSGIAKLKTSTGDIRVEGTNTGTLDLSVTTGQVTVSNVTCDRDVSIGVSTGKARVTDLNCLNLASHGTTGDLTLTNVVATGSFQLKRGTGDIHFDKCDADQITAKTTTGDVTGSLLSDKIFLTHTSTGNIDVPKTAEGGKCEISTGTGDIKISIEA